VFNKPLHVPETAETTALGAAISAAVGCGMYADFKTAVDTMVNVKKSYQPKSDNVARYDRFYREVYVKLFDSIQQHMRTIAEINESLDK
jgi:xylulokinase